MEVLLHFLWDAHMVNIIVIQVTHQPQIAVIVILALDLAILVTAVSGHHPGFQEVVDLEIRLGL